MLARPNGSGKSFLVPLLAEEVNLGVIVNADELEATLRKQPFSPRLLNLRNWNVQLTDAELQEFAARPGSQRLPKEQASQLRIEQNVLLLGNAHLNSYLAAWIAELLRFHLLASRQSLTFETVMSHSFKAGLPAGSPAGGLPHLPVFRGHGRPGYQYCPRGRARSQRRPPRGAGQNRGALPPVPVTAAGRP